LGKFYQEDGSGASTSYEYDGWGRVIVEKPEAFAAKRYSYNRAARTRQVTDGENHPIQETYDVAGRILQKKEIRPAG